MIKKHFRLTMAIGVAGLFLLLIQTRLEANGATFTVNNQLDIADDDPGNGVCETGNGNGICTLRAAIQETNALSGADSIIVPSGTYTLTLKFEPDDDDAVGDDLDITDDLTILGADPITTIIDGNLMVRVLHVVFPQLEVQISGITVTGDNITSGFPGNGIYNLGTLYLDNAIIDSNEGDGDAEVGAIYNNGDMTISNSIISNNEGYYGGGVYNDGVMIITESEIRGNLASKGAGIYNHGILTVEKVLVELNTADEGGGIFIEAGPVIIKDSILFSNSAIGRDGGGIYDEGFAELLTIQNSTIHNNMTVQSGGGIANLGLLSMINSTVSGNTAAGSGGGLYSPGFGGQTFLYSTITNNTATNTNWDGIYWEDGGSDTTFEGVILAGNGDGDDNCWGTSPPNSNGYNLDSGTSCGFTDPNDINSANPLLGPLADNGGPTLTHALDSLSPAIDEGGGPDCPDEDQRHSPRPSDGDGNGSAVCDIGAYEYTNYSFYAFMSALFKP